MLITRSNQARREKGHCFWCNFERSVLERSLLSFPVKNFCCFLGLDRWVMRGLVPYSSTHHNAIWKVVERSRPALAGREKDRIETALLEPSKNLPSSLRQFLLILLRKLGSGLPSEWFNASGRLLKGPIRPKARIFTNQGKVSGK